MSHMNSNSRFTTRITTRITRHMQTEARTPNPHSILICALLPHKQGNESNFRRQIGTQLWEHQISATVHLNPAGLEMTSKCAHEFHFEVHGGTVDRSGASRVKWAVKKLQERVAFIDLLW